ncbi:MAG: oligosaccharide flippase family protein [Mycobacterium sp.]
MSKRTSTRPQAEAVSRQNLLSSAWWMTGSNLLSQCCAYGSLVLLARWLVPASFGTVAVGMAIVGVAVLFVDQGTWGAVVVERGLNRADLRRAFWRCMATAVVLAVAMSAAAGPVVDRFATGGDVAAVAALALCLPLHAIAVVPTALLQRQMQFRRLASLTGVANVLSALVAVALALADLGVWALVARQLILFATMALLSAVLCLPVLRTYEPSDTPTPRHQRGRQERWFFMFTVTDSVTGSLDKLIIGLFGNAALVGLYSIAGTIAMSPWKQFSAQIGQVLFAAAASEPANARERTERSLQLMAMVLLPLLPFGVLVAPTILPAVLGPEWAPMVPAFQVLLVVGIGNAVVNCIAEALTGLGYMAFRAKLIAAQGVATLLTLAILVPIGGILGAALAQLVVFVPYAAMYFTAGARRVDTSTAILLRRLRPSVTALILQVAVSLAVLIGLLLMGAAGSAAACAAASVGVLVCLPMVVRNFARLRS